MKLVRLRTTLQNFNSQLHLGNASAFSSYSTAATLAPRYLRTEVRDSNSNSMHALYRRISPIGEFRVSIVPLLDQWVEEGRAVDKQQLEFCIKNLRSFGRYSHALQVSMWMTDKRYFWLNPVDVAIRLELISKVQGIEQAENYFNNVPKQLREPVVYAALLNCYVHAKSVEKGEATMQKIRDLGFARKPTVYNPLLNLYYQTGNNEKLEYLLQEMEEKGIGYNKMTYSIRLSAYAAASDVEGLDKTVGMMESDPNFFLDWTTYATAASAYAKTGFLEKALSMLKKSEGLIMMDKKRSQAYKFLITQYAACRKKNEVLRLWEIYKRDLKVYNKGYLSVIPSLLKFDDLESAEKIFMEWESQNLSYDFRIPNFLIGAYCRNGLLQKAESVIHGAKLKGGKPDWKTWFYMATGYLWDNQTLKAVDAMREALLVCQNSWKPSKECLAVSLKFLKGGVGDVKEADNFIQLLRDKGIISEDVQDRWLNNVENGKLSFDALSELYGDALFDNAEALFKPEDDQVEGHSIKG